MDLLLLGSLTNFTVIDKVPAALKPQRNDGPANEEGIKIQGGTNATLVIDARGFENDTLIEVRESSYVRVTDRSDSTVVESLTHFESDVNHLVILTNNFEASALRLPIDTEPPIDDFDFGGIDDKDHSNWRSGEGTNVFVSGLPSGIDLLVDTGDSGTFNKVLIGHDSVAEQVTVLTGAGDDTVAVQRDSGDDSADVVVDFVYADQMGLGNMLVVQSQGTARLGAPGHPTYVDTVKVRGAGSGTRGEVILEHEAEIDDLDVQNWGILTVATDDALVNSLSVDNDGKLVAQKQATIEDFELRGTAFFHSTSATSTIDTLDLRGNGVLDLDGAAVLAIATLTSDFNPTINAPNTSTLTVTNASVIGGTLTMNLANQGAANVSVTNTFTVNGTLNVNDGGLLTVNEFSAGAGVVSVDDGAEVLILTDSTIGTLNITDAGIVTIQQRDDVSTDDARVLVINNSLNLGSPSSPTGTLDVKDNDVIVFGGLSSNSARQLIGSGYHSGAWDGLGITSSRAATSPNTGEDGKTAIGYAEASQVGFSTFHGVSLNSNTIVIKYTYAGDTNLDGMVDVADLGSLASNWQASGEWYQGDSDYTGFVDVNDLGLLASNWQAGSGGPLFGGGDPVQEFLDGIEELELTQNQIEWLLEILGEGGGDPL